MYEAIYQFTLKPPSLAAYTAQWKKMATYMLSKGAVSSTLYFNFETGKCLIHSRWPSRAMKDANWPLPEEADKELKNAASLMKGLRSSDVELLELSPADLSEYLKNNRMRLSGNVRRRTLFENSCLVFMLGAIVAILAAGVSKSTEHPFGF